MLWLMPLTIYLITFILCFDGQRWYSREAFFGPVLIAIAAMGWLLVDKSRQFDLLATAIVFGLGLFAVCMFCHGELVASKPDPRHLGRFYAIVALGGGVSESPQTFGIFAGFKSQNALAAHADPTKASRPFDKARNGIVISEGGCIYTLERLEDAQARGSAGYALQGSVRASGDVVRVVVQLTDMGTGSAMEQRLVVGADGEGIVVEEHSLAGVDDEVLDRTGDGRAAGRGSRQRVAARRLRLRNRLARRRPWGRALRRRGDRRRSLLW